MATATMTSKGQMTVPVEVREALGLKTGSRVEFIKIDEGQFAIVVANKDIRSLKGILRKPVVPVTIEQMNATIAACGALAG